MSRVAVFTTLAGTLALLLMVSGEEGYEGRWEQMDVDEILGNQRILNSFIKCFLDQGPCTADAKDIRNLIPEMIDSFCGKCTPKQKKLMAKAIKFVKDNRPEDWEQLSKKYDPDQTKGVEVDRFIKESLEV